MTSEAFNLEENQDQLLLDAIKDCNSYLAVAIRKYLKSIDRQDMRIQESNARFRNLIQKDFRCEINTTFDTVKNQIIIEHHFNDMMQLIDVKSNYITEEEIEVIAIAQNVKESITSKEKTIAYPITKGYQRQMKVLMHQGKFVQETFLFDDIKYERNPTKLYELDQSIEEMVNFYQEFCNLGDPNDEVIGDSNWIDNIRKCHFQEVTINIPVDHSNN